MISLYTPQNSTRCWRGKPGETHRYRIFWIDSGNWQTLAINATLPARDALKRSFHRNAGPESRQEE